MKAFSRVPDPFGQHLQTLNYEFAIKPVIQIEAIPQGKIRCNAHHVIANSTLNKHNVLSIDLREDSKQQFAKNSQNTAITSGNRIEQNLPGKQKQNQVEKGESEQNQKIVKSLGSHINSDERSSKIIKTPSEKNQQILSPNKQTSQQLYQQRHASLRVQSVSKQMLSHIIFSTPQDQIPRGFFAKRPIFPKDKQASPVSKKENQEAKNIIANQEQQAHEEIECSFFNNTIKKEDPNQMKNTGFSMIDSFAGSFSRPASLSEVGENQTKQRPLLKNLGKAFEDRKYKFKQLGGKKLIVPRQQKKQHSKLQLTQATNINPVFF